MLGWCPQRLALIGRKEAQGAQKDKWLAGALKRFALIGRKEAQGAQKG